MAETKSNAKTWKQLSRKTSVGHVPRGKRLVGATTHENVENIALVTLVHRK